MLEFIGTVVKPDASFWGGNIIPHNLDRGSEEENSDIIDKFIKTSLQYFTKNKQQQLFFAIGNQDSFPENSFNPSKPGTNKV